MSDFSLDLAVAAIFVGGLLVGFGARGTWRRTAPAGAPIARSKPAASIPTLRGDVMPALPTPEPKPGETVYALGSAAENYAINRGTVLAADSGTVQLAEHPDTMISAEFVFAAKRDAQREAHLRLERLVRALATLPPRGTDDERSAARRREFDDRLAALKRLEAEMTADE
ncbi:MAG: hypothetical protein NVSMB64_12560 [Candidatus Velthaea sp.]